MRLITGVVLAAIVAGAILLLPIVNGFIQARGLSAVISEISSGPIPIAVQIWGFLLKRLPEILFAGAILVVLNSFLKYPPRMFTDISTGNGIELNQPDNSSKTTIMVEDFEYTLQSHLENSNSRTETSTQQSLNSELDSGPDFELDAITEAKVFARLGRRPQAISLLLEKFYIEEENLDDFALELSRLFEREIEYRFDNDEDTTDLISQRNQFLELVSRRSPLLSSEVWFRLCEKFPNDLLSPNDLENVFRKRQVATG